LSDHQCLFKRSVFARVTNFRLTVYPRAIVKIDGSSIQDGAGIQLSREKYYLQLMPIEGVIPSDWILTLAAEAKTTSSYS